MGSGKSTVGSELASMLGFRLVDTDEVVEQRARRSVEDIWNAEGEDGFREREHRAVKHAVARGGRVIACGGGAILQLRNFSILKEAGPVIYLRATPDTLRKRLRDPKGRPLMRKPGALEKLLTERAPAYEEAADVIVDVDRLTPAQIAERIVEALL